MTEIYKKAFREKNTEVYDEEVYQKQENQTKPVVVLKDIGKAKLRDEHVAYEIDKLTPNYGASSDLLRYHILYQYGGAYFDSDVAPGENSIEKICSLTYRQPVLYVDHCSQQIYANEEQLKTFTTEKIGNDTLICTLKNPLMLQINLDAHKNYTISDFGPIILQAHSGKNIQDATIARTGPKVIQTLLQDAKPIENDLRKDNVIIKRVRDGQIALTQPLPNAADWLDISLTKLPLKDVCKRVEQTILFEAEYFHCLRLDDHIDDLTASCKDFENITAQQALEKLSSYIKPIKDKIKYVQILCKYSESIQFCKEQTLPTLFKLKTGYDTVINQQARNTFILRVEQYAQSTQIEVISVLKNRIPLPSLEMLNKNIQQATDYMADVMSQLGNFGNKKEEVKKFILSWLEKYQTYGEAINTKVKLEYQVNIDRINNLIKTLTDNDDKLLTENAGKLHIK